MIICRINFIVRIFVNVDDLVDLDLGAEGDLVLLFRFARRLASRLDARAVHGDRQSVALSNASNEATKQLVAGLQEMDGSVASSG